ncbi:MAG: hypothetical protein QOH50_5108, partial [Kribbellaceae bacterium]|nr:hypothetical protein [Kribbellaceae bacterium]
MSTNQLSVILTGDENWHLFIELVKTKSLESNTWRYVNPAALVEAILAHTRPIEPTFETVHPRPQGSQVPIVLADLSPIEYAHYQELKHDYRDSLKEYIKTEEALAKMRTLIQNSVKSELITHTLNCPTARDMLLNLRAEFEANREVRERQLLAKYHKAKRLSATESLENWIRNWETTYIRCREINASEVDGAKPLFDFIHAVQDRVPGFHTAWYFRILREGASLNIRDLIQELKDYLRDTNLGGSKGRNAGFATFQDQKAPESQPTAQSNQPANQSNQQRKPPKCICGERHWFDHCPYLNFQPSARQPGWNPDPAIQKTVESRLADQDMKAKVEKARAKTQRKLNQSSGESNLATALCAFNIPDVTDAFTVGELDDNRQYIRSSTPEIHSIPQGQLWSAAYGGGSNAHSYQGDPVLRPNPAGYIASNHMKTTTDLSTTTIKSITITSPVMRTSTAMNATPAITKRWDLYNSFILDSGATTHICHTRDRFKSFRPTEEALSTAGAPIQIHGYGDVDITIQGAKGPRTITLKDTAYIPDCTTNMISCHKVLKAGIIWDQINNQLTQFGQTYCKITVINDLYVIEHNPITFQQAAFIAKRFTKSTAPKPDQEVTVQTLHRRFAHASLTAVKHLPKASHGITITNPEDQFSCEVCFLAKGKKLIHREPTQPPRAPYEVVAFDLIEFKPVDQDAGLAKYALHFYCRFTGMNHVYILPDKAENTLLHTIQEFCAYITRRWSLKVCVFQTDGEKGLGHNSVQWIKREGISLNRSPTSTQDQNGGAERSGGVIIMRARSIHIDSELPPFMWPEVLLAAGYLLNRTPRQSHNWKTPLEVLQTFMKFKDPKPKCGHIRVY